MVFFHFKMVETLAVNAHDSTLRDESMRINVVDHTIKQACFTLLGDHDQHFQVVARVITAGVDNGATAVRSSAVMRSHISS